MAGTNPAFDAAAVRTALQTAMVMGQPTDPLEQMTFIWLEHDTYVPAGHNHPYSWTQTPTAVVSSARSVVQINCAIEYTAGAIDADSMGGFDASKAVLTLLDTDYALVAGADQVRYGGITYMIDPPGAVPIGLFDLTVWQIRISARA